MGNRHTYCCQMFIFCKTVNPAQAASQTRWNLAEYLVQWITWEKLFVCYHKATNDACIQWSCQLLVSFCLSSETNSGQDNSHSKCTLWTLCLRQAKPSVTPHPYPPHLECTTPGLVRFSPLLLHIKYDDLLSLAAHVAKPTRLWALTADTPQSVSKLTL